MGVIKGDTRSLDYGSYGDYGQLEIGVPLKGL